MRAFICVVMVAFGPMIAHAGSYTVTTTPEQDQALAREIQLRIPEPKSTLPPMTPQQMIQHIVNQRLADGVAAVQRDAAKAAACAKVTDAQARQTLGCAVPPTPGTSAPPTTVPLPTK